MNAAVDVRVMAPRRAAAGLAAGQMVQLMAAGGLRVLYGDCVRTRAWMASGQVPRMADESGSMSGRRMLPPFGQRRS
jgi:hypothetical protein